ncbi:Ccc1 family [Podospora appendiculata]|uniref:Ccc1 family n=1 Tax=Podospora appendiculata TaxID=314037 RepID=A0AAE1C7P5_9PEZI|nr:Ccc1 family [Podospora appendiculata]
MGIGGYLSAKGEQNAAAAGADEAPHSGGGGSRDEEEEAAFFLQPTTSVAAAVGEYLAPLDLPPHLSELVIAHAVQNPQIGLLLLAAKTAAECDARADNNATSSSSSTRSPIMAGLSVACGYLLGGLLPLSPYFFVSDVEDGLIASFIVCILALFVFGFVKDFVLSRGRWREKRRRAPATGIPWKDIRRSSWEGLQMAVLGSVAAGAAVLCVMLFDRSHGA